MTKHLIILNPSAAKGAALKKKDEIEQHRITVRIGLIVHAGNNSAVLVAGLDDVADICFLPAFSR